jgi:hypothetical protein
MLYIEIKAARPRTNIKQNNIKGNRKAWPEGWLNPSSVTFLSMAKKAVLLNDRTVVAAMVIAKIYLYFHA